MASTQPARWSSASKGRAHGIGCLAEHQADHELAQTYLSGESPLAGRGCLGRSRSVLWEVVVSKEAEGRGGKVRAGRPLRLGAFGWVQLHRQPCELTLGGRGCRVWKRPASGHPAGGTQGARGGEEERRREECGADWRNGRESQPWGGGGLDYGEEWIALESRVGQGVCSRTPRQSGRSERRKKPSGRWATRRGGRARHGSPTGGGVLAYNDGVKPRIQARLDRGVTWRRWRPGRGTRPGKGLEGILPGSQPGRLGLSRSSQGWRRAGCGLISAPRGEREAWRRMSP